jgi:hypothetical protein
MATPSEATATNFTSGGPPTSRLAHERDEDGLVHEEGRERCAAHRGVDPSLMVEPALEEVDVWHVSGTPVK